MKISYSTLRAEIRQWGEFRPCFNDKSEFDDTDIVHLQYLEQDLSFWDSEDDDDIFENQ
jgi:hypothetical protein